MVRFTAAESVALDVNPALSCQARMAYRKAHEAHLVAAIKAGNEEAFEELFQEFYHSMLRVARLRVSTVDEADEVVQQVFFNVWQMRSNWSPRGSAGAYLLGAVRRQLLFKWRTDARRQRVLDRLAVRDDMPGVLPRCSQPDDVLRTSEVSAAMQRAVAGLSDRLRQTFILAKQGKWTTEELAEHLGISPGAVRMNLKRAYRLLRSQLSEYI